MVYKMSENGRDNSKKSNNQSLDEVAYPDIEPDIISKQMIETAYLEDGYHGEEARLHRIEPVVYERINSLRLDFKSKQFITK